MASVMAESAAGGEAVNNLPSVVTTDHDHYSTSTEIASTDWVTTDGSTADGGGDGTDFMSCWLPNVFSSDKSDYNAVTATFTGLYLFFGLFCALFGYRCFKAIMFLTGFIFGSIIVYLICLEENIFPLWANTLIAVAAGILFGLITLLVQYVGLFVLGFHGGLLCGIVGLVLTDVIRRALHNYSQQRDIFSGTTDSSMETHSPWISVAILLSTGLVASLFNLYFQKSLTILNSALYGGAVVATCLDYFAESSVMLMWIWNKVRVKEEEEGDEKYCWFSWAILATWPAFTIIGLVTQCVVTGNGIYHEQQFSTRRVNAKQRSRKPTETREERKQRKYRYLYQVRTCHGDVISQPISKKYVHQVDEPCA